MPKPFSRAINRNIRNFLEHDPRVRALSVVRWQPYLAWCLADWALVAAAAAFVELSASRLAYLAACLLIAGRQHAFFVLTHEAAHYRISRSHDLNSSRNVAAPWLERILFSPHNIHYHLDHHLIASVPFYNLPRLHALLREQPVFREHAHENTSYLLPSARPVTKDLLGETPAAGPEEERRAA